METAYTGQVYSAVVAVARALSVQGITKARRNAAQQYDFRGIDDVYNALAPLLAENKLAIFPSVVDRSVTERKSANGNALFCVTVTVEYMLINAEDGSGVTVRTVGEAMDSGDKATNKAMSAAYKYMVLQTFCVPTQGDHDSENPGAADAGVQHEGRMTEKARADFRAAMEAAATIGDLEREWKTAASACQAGHDLESHAELREFAMRRKATFTAASHP